MDCNLIVYGYTEWYLVKPKIKIYFNDEYLGEVIYKDSFEYQIESDGILTLKCSVRKTQIKVYKDKINKIQVQFDRFTGQLVAAYK